MSEDTREQASSLLLTNTPPCWILVFDWTAQLIGLIHHNNTGVMTVSRLITTAKFYSGSEQDDDDEMICHFPHELLFWIRVSRTVCLPARKNVNIDCDFHLVTCETDNILY